MHPNIHLSAVDYSILLICFVFVIVMTASAAKYGIMTCHFYWVGAIPAMVFLAVFMMPFYYGSKARSVPEYLKMRFDEKTRGLNSLSFAVMTVFSSGISLHALARLLETLVHWDSPNTHTDPCLVAYRAHLSEKQFPNIFIIAAMLMLGAAVSLAAEWPQFRGPTGNGISPDARINMDWSAKPPAVLWTFRMSDSGWSNPAVGDNKVFVIDHVTSESKDAEGKVTEQKGEDMVRALDMKTGKEIWSFAYPGMPQERNGTTGPSPALNDGKLYTVSRGMLVHCLDAKTGRNIWERNCAKDFDARPSEVPFGHNASPLVDENRLILIPGAPDVAVVALDKNTGTTLWKAPGSNAGHSTPIAYGSGKSKQYIAFIGEGLVGLNPETGARLWSYEWKTSNSQNSATPLVIENRIFFASAFKMGAGLLDISNAASPTLVWKNIEAQVRFSSPVCLNGNIYCTSMPENPGYLLCLNAETGAINWKQPGFNFGPLSAAGGALIAVAGKTSDVVLIEPSAAAYKELGRIHPSEPTAAWNAAIVVDGRMYVRTKKMLTCYDVVP